MSLGAFLYTKDFCRLCLYICCCYAPENIDFFSYNNLSGSVYTLDAADVQHFDALTFWVYLNYEFGFRQLL